MLLSPVCSSYIKWKYPSSPSLLRYNDTGESGTNQRSPQSGSCASRGTHIDRWGPV